MTTSGTGAPSALALMRTGTAASRPTGLTTSCDGSMDDKMGHITRTCRILTAISYSTPIILQPGNSEGVIPKGIVMPRVQESSLPGSTLPLLVFAMTTSLTCREGKNESIRKVRSRKSHVRPMPLHSFYPPMSR